MRESVSILERSKNSSNLSTLQRMTVWESDYQSVARLSRAIMGGSGLHRTMARELHSHSLFRGNDKPILKHNRRALLGDASFVAGRGLPKQNPFPEATWLSGCKL